MGHHQAAFLTATSSLVSLEDDLRFALVVHGPPEAAPKFESGSNGEIGSSALHRHRHPNA
jgi:hypothetical protein